MNVIAVEKQLVLATEVDLDTDSVRRIFVAGECDIPVCFIEDGDDRRPINERDPQAGMTSLLLAGLGDFDGVELYPRLALGGPDEGGWSQLLHPLIQREQLARTASPPPWKAWTGVSVEQEITFLVRVEPHLGVVLSVSLSAAGSAVPQFYAPAIDEAGFLAPDHPAAIRASAVLAEFGPFPGAELYPNLLIWGRPGEAWFDLVNGRHAPRPRPEIAPLPVPAPIADTSLEP